MKRVVIYPMGIGMLILLILLGPLTLPAFPVMAIGLFVFKSPDLNIVHVFAGLIATIAGVYFVYQFFFNSKVVIENNRFIFNSGGSDKKMYPAINIDCQALVDFVWTYTIVFKKSNGERLVFGSVTFSRKQILRILKEVQARGGLQGIDIEKQMKIKKRTKK